MSDEPTLIYLEADDEITTVVRRVRDAEPGRVVLIAPGRSRATSSSVAMRLLARAGQGERLELAIVGDALTRSLAAEAGLATYRSVEEARRADPGEAAAAEDPAEARTAAIHVVRGPAPDDTAPTLAAMAVADQGVTRETETERVRAPARPTAQSRRRSASKRPRPRPRRFSLAAILGLLLAVLVGWGAVAAVVLPAATVTITPHAERLGPVVEVFMVTDVERVSGIVNETATVNATGTYDINAPAVGRVTFFNFNFFDVQVPAESLVATGVEPGDQAFATSEAITVPAGTFDPFFGGITAGEASVDITAAATGPNGNVDAETIDTILDPGLEGQLRGFPTISENLVVNTEPTSGGAIEAGREITQEDVDAAVAELTDALRSGVENALAGREALVRADASGGAEPEISGLDGLVGTRDLETTEINGSLAYNELAADRDDIEPEAVTRVADDASLVPDGWLLDPTSLAVEVVAARVVSEGLEVEVRLTGSRIQTVDPARVLPMIAGLEPEAARAALASLGTATVELWPVWVGAVPDRAWRVEIVVLEP